MDMNIVYQALKFLMERFPLGLGATVNDINALLLMKTTLPETNIAPENGWLEY